LAQVGAQSVEALQAELKTLRHELADGERELDDVRTRLDRFARHYRVTVGDRFEMLLTLQGAADAVAESQQVVPAEVRRRAPGREEVERLYRDLARRVHPDLARDPDELRLRTKIMAELNSARETLDFDRVRKLGDAWELRPDGIAPDPQLGPRERLLLGIERLQARLTAVAADLVRLRSSNLHVLMEMVEAQRRAGVDVLAETAADLDLQIAEARSRMAISKMPPGAIAEWQRRRGDLALPATETGASRPIFTVTLAFSLVILAGSLALLVAAAGVDADSGVVSVTRPSAAPMPSALRPTTTPAPRDYTVVERQVSTAGRTTATVRIVVDGEPSFDEKIATLANAARRELRSQQAVVVLAYRSALEIGGPFTVGRAYLSTDGRGWSGDRETPDGPDNGGVVGSVVERIGTTVETRMFTAPR
jgi:hypothetical protein